MNFRRLIATAIIPALIVDISWAEFPLGTRHAQVIDMTTQALAPSPDFSIRGALTRIKSVRSDAYIKRAAIRFLALARKSPLTIVNLNAQGGAGALEAWEDLQDEGPGALKLYQQQNAAEKLDGRKILNGAYVIQSRSGAGNKPWTIKVRPVRRSWSIRRQEIPYSMPVSRQSRLTVNRDCD